MTPPLSLTPPARIFIPGDWHWVDAPVLYPKVAEEEGITTADPEKIINWLQAH
jgi:hypothetical protein